ncbi:hypothetical protein [Parvibacter caecicola]|uniref:Uncharacterized protein n=1 Tax=Parvibacter caecicola TaxID=747645 RepID=A0A7W5D3L4_9ACTN|nr:hypothetical protein [Parvibacter caecicola]MBB3171771.1 hypothetical protein [Parvibacter caecicola]MCR2040667.1 hypothetical protein [Parvibacter caecicola]
MDEEIGGSMPEKRATPRQFWRTRGVDSAGSAEYSAYMLPEDGGEDYPPWVYAVALAAVTGCLWAPPLAEALFAAAGL